MGEKQIDELVEITDGWMPLPIKRTLIEAHRLYTPMMREKDPDFVLTAEVVKERFEAEAARKERTKELEAKSREAREAPEERLEEAP